MKSSKKKDVHDIAIIRYGIRRERIRLQHYLSMKVLKPIRIAKKAIDTFRQSLMKELEAISPVIESSRNIILEDLH